MLLFLLLILPAIIHAADTNLRGFPPKEAEQEKEWEDKERAVPQPDKIQDYIRHMSEKPHHAGSPGSKAVAAYLLGLLRGWGLDASIEEFEALLPTPTQRKLELLAPTRFTAKLQEPAVS